MRWGPAQLRQLRVELSCPPALLESNRTMFARIGIAPDRGEAKG
jgi:hypothetical protein